MKRHTTFFADSVKTINFCNTQMFEVSGSVFELPFEIRPTEGEHDFNKCENCQNNLKELINRLTEKFEGTKDKKGFPFCCTYHVNLLNIKQFDRASFTEVPVMVAHKIIYTSQHIKNNFESDNWYKIITDYMENIICSFGQMPKGCGEALFLSDYFDYTTNLLKGCEDVPPNKKDKLMEYINLYFKPNKKATTDFNVLIGTYEKWLKIFPFEISYFSNIKQHFEKQLPILNGKPEVNMYSGIAKAKMHTKSSLTEALISLTNDLLTGLNGLILYEKGQLTDPLKIKMELIINSRKMKLKQGYYNSSPNEEQRYRNILKEWFKDEKKFIDEISPVMKELSPQLIKTETDKLSLREIALLYYFKNEKITIGNQDTFAEKHQQENAGKKLYSDHYKRIVEDGKEIYQHKYSKKYLENIKSYIADSDTIKKIDSFIKKCN